MAILAATRNLPHSISPPPLQMQVSGREPLDHQSPDTTSPQTPQSSGSSADGLEREAQDSPPSDVIPSPELSNSELAARWKRERKRSGTKLEHFELIRVVGKGCAGRVDSSSLDRSTADGQVLLVRHSPTNTCHAMKAISKRSVLLTGELEHTMAELSILKRFAMYEPYNQFVCKLNYAFTDRENFYFVMDFYPGGDLATQMEIHGALGATRTRFYACDIVQALEDMYAILSSHPGAIGRD